MTGAIDFHAHILVPEVWAVTKAKSLFALPPEGPRLSEDAMRQASQRSEAVLAAMADVTERLQRMDEMGVAVQVLTQSLVHQCTYWAPPEESLRLERQMNDRMAAIVAANRSRYVGLGGVPLQAPALAVAELERCVCALGLEGVGISTFAGGREIGHPDLHPFWAKAEELGALVTIHPAGNPDPRFRKHFLWNSIGQSFEEAMAIASLMYEGVLDRYPDLKICISHGGGYMPFNMGRIDRNWQEKPSTRANMKLPPGDFLRRLHYDSCLYDPVLLERLVEKVGEDRVVLGSDYPVGEKKPIEFVRACKLPAGAADKIIHANAARLLGLDVSLRT